MLTNMRFNILVTVPFNDSDESKIYESVVNEVMERFDINRVVPEYKTYPSAEDIKSRSEHYRIPITDLESIAEKSKDWNGAIRTGVETGRLFEIRTDNPVGKCDYWNILGLIDTFNLEELKEFVFGEKNNLVVSAVVTPEKEWIQGPYFLDIDSLEDKEEYRRWTGTLVKIIHQYRNEYTFWLVNCHS